MAAQNGFVGILQVVDGAELKCDQGTQHSNLVATTSDEIIEHKRVATESDYKFGKNIFSFGECKANGNKPCAAKFSAPWFGAFSGGATSGFTQTRHLHLNCRLGCTAHGGVVTIVNSCQSTVSVGDPDPEWTAAVVRLYELLHNADVELAKIWAAEAARREEEGEMSTADHVSAVFGEGALALGASGGVALATGFGAPLVVPAEGGALALQTISAGADLVDGMNRQNKKKEIAHQEKLWSGNRSRIIEQLKGFGAWNETRDKASAGPAR